MELPRLEIIEKCVGCNKAIKIDDVYKCKVYSNPLSKWSYGINCPMATHIKKEKIIIEKKLNPIKASKKKKR